MAHSAKLSPFHRHWMEFYAFFAALLRRWLVQYYYYYYYTIALHKSKRFGCLCLCLFSSGRVVACVALSLLAGDPLRQTKAAALVSEEQKNVAIYDMQSQVTQKTSYTRLRVSNLRYSGYDCWSHAKKIEKWVRKISKERINHSHHRSIVSTTACERYLLKTMVL